MTTSTSIDFYTQTQADTLLGAKADEVDLTAHTSRTDNPHAVTKTQVGLDRVDNTADVDKPVSTAQQTALDAKVAKAANLSDLANPATARTNLGLGDAATHPATDFATAAQGAKADAALPAPAGPLKGDLLVNNGTGWVPLRGTTDGQVLIRDSTQTSGWRFGLDSTIHGNGFPEGVVTAAVGRRYVDDSATNGAVEWVKASGTGNVGWQVVTGDTGMRDPSSQLLNGWTATSILICRKGSIVSLVYNGLNGTAATANQFLPPLTGYMPTQFVSGYNVLIPWTTSSTLATLWGGSAGLTLTRTTAPVSGGASGSYGATWQTRDQWPIS